MLASSSKPVFGIEELAGKSLAGLLLEVQDRARPIKTSVNLRCLHLPQSLTDHGAITAESIGQVFMGSTRKYVAISYSCEDISDSGDGDIEGPAVVQHPESRSSNWTINVVLKRASRYANHIRCPYIWIDQYCIDQTNEIEKRISIDSMHLVYSGSEFPVALLSTVLKTANSILLLRALLDGELASEDGINADCDKRKIEQVLNLLQSISADRWWTRAFTFQEEYLSGIRMMLLVRVIPKLEGLKKRIFSHSGKIDEEICFGAAHFRKVATLFLYALQKSPLILWRQKATKLLKVFSKYNVLYDLTTFANGKAMSPRIIADLHERKIKQKFDSLLIAANTLGYTERFEANEMATTECSVNLCTLAMFLLNGEIISNNDKLSISPFSKSTGDFFDHVSFKRFDPPVAAGELSFLKNCRLLKPRFVPSGIQTTGHLWEVMMEIHTQAWQPPSRPRLRKSSRYGLNNRQRAYILQLIEHVSRRKHCKILVKHLRDYLDDDLEPQHTAVKRYKDLMANELCNAIENGDALYLAAIHGTDKIKAIFVGPCNQGASVFTAWSHRTYRDRRPRTRHVSLSVCLEKQVSGQHPPHLKLQEWVNGLTFFTWREQRSVVVSWPEAWLRTNPEVIVLPDDEDP